MIQKSLLYFICGFAFVFISCGEDEDIDLLNQQEIENYISENNLNAQSTNSGLYYVIETPGNGEHPVITSRVTTHYRGYLTNGQEFDSSYSRGSPSEFGLNQVIPGWQEGIPLFSKGGAGKLLIPSKLAYGENPPPESIIPQNAVLIFDIELIDFQ